MSSRAELESDVRPFGNSVDQLKHAGPFDCLVQPRFRWTNSRASSSHAGNGSRPAGTARLLGLIQPEVATKSRRPVGDFEKDGAKVVDERRSRAAPASLGFSQTRSGRALRAAGWRESFSRERRGGSPPSIPKFRAASPRRAPDDTISWSTTARTSSGLLPSILPSSSESGIAPPDSLTSFRIGFARGFIDRLRQPTPASDGRVRAA